MGCTVSRFQSFSVAGSIRQMDSIATFMRHLKTSLLWKRTVCLINSLLLVKLLFPLIFRLLLLYCILRHFILFSAAVQYCKRRYTNSFCDCYSLLRGFT